jgi:hypothetical protein
METAHELTQHERDGYRAAGKPDSTLIYYESQDH